MLACKLLRDPVYTAFPTSINIPYAMLKPAQETLPVSPYHRNTRLFNFLSPKPFRERLGGLNQSLSR
eukprot:UN10251